MLRLARASLPLSRCATAGPLLARRPASAASPAGSEEELSAAQKARLAAAQRSAELPFNPAKLHFVRQVRSGINQPAGVQRTLAALRLRGLQQVAVLKNTPATNGMLGRVLHLVKIQPLRFAPARPAPPGSRFFLTDDGVVLGGTEEEYLAHMAQLEAAEVAGLTPEQRAEREARRRLQRLPVYMRRHIKKKQLREAERAARAQAAGRVPRRPDDADASDA